MKAVKDESGNESIAIRKKYTKRRPFGKTSENVKSLINIYHVGNDGVWVDPFDEKESLDEETSNLINSILSWMGAEETGDPCVWKLNLTGAEEENKEDDNNNVGDNTNIDNTIASKEELEVKVHESVEDAKKFAYLVYDDADCIVGAFPNREQADKFANEFAKENNVETTVKRIYRSEIETKD